MERFQLFLHVVDEAVLLILLLLELADGILLTAIKRGDMREAGQQIKSEMTKRRRLFCAPQRRRRAW